MCKSAGLKALDYCITDRLIKKGKEKKGEKHTHQEGKL
jgi:hypothetical protein